MDLRGRRDRIPLLDGWVCLGVALLAMFGVVMFVVAAADHVLWVIPAAGCLALAAYACTRLYCRLFYGR
jgi:hypothetical protein